MPDDDLRVGDHVRIRRDQMHPPGPWPAEPMGVVAEHPMSIGSEIWRPVDTTLGPRRFYWIRFDAPQLDTDGDGPYRVAEVLDVYIERTPA